jgi:small subunit ribosomal protein S20
MPQRKCAQKRLRADKNLIAHNQRIKSDLKKILKGMKTLIATGKIDEAKAQLAAAYAKLDRAVTKGILHKNTAARRKSSLASKLNKKA